MYTFSIIAFFIRMILRGEINEINMHDVTLPLLIPLYELIRLSTSKTRPQRDVE
jgi:hypothetical protein